jgi:hypothetical protein
MKKTKLSDKVNKGLHVLRKKLEAVMKAGAGGASSGGGSGGKIGLCSGKTGSGEAGGSDGTANAFSLDNVDIDFSNVANKTAIDSKVDSDKVSVQKSRRQDTPDVDFEL